MRRSPCMAALFGAALSLLAAGANAAGKSRLFVTPWVGVSTVRLGGLDTFPNAAVTNLTNIWKGAPFFESVSSQSRHGVDWAFIQGLDVCYQLDALVRVSGRLGYMRTGEGSRRTVTSGAGTFHDDVWNYSSEVLILGGGAGFTFPVTERSRAIINLNLGAGFASITAFHRIHFYMPGESFIQSDVFARGIGFFPEFAAEYEYDLMESLTAGLRLGYRFGGVNKFSSRRSSSINYIFAGNPEFYPGDTLRDGDKNIVSVDYGGVFLSMLVSVRY